MGDEQNQVNTAGAEVQNNQQETGSQVDTTVNQDANTGNTVDEGLQKAADEMGFSVDDEVFKEVYNANKKEDTKPEGKAEPQKIKIGEKEYTREELLSLPEDEFQKVIKPEDKSTFRQENEIAQDYVNLKENTTKSLKNVFDKYIALSNAPADAEGNKNYKDVQDALSHGIKTGDYSYFYQYLNPVDVATFKDEKEKIENDYIQKIKPLENESKSYIEHQNMSKWDTYIKDNAKDEQESYVLQEFKKLYPNNLVEKEMEVILKTFRDARSIEINKKVLKEQTEQVKKAMMSTNTSTPIPQQKEYSKEEISSMNYETFEKLLNEGEFDKYLK
jgi:hypothetical protein